ncbi:MAG: hypothetical protein ACE5IY_06345 [bacterium]
MIKTDSSANSAKYTRSAKEVIQQELGHIKKKKNLWGLAISGGGIRSASFGLGVMQALVANGVMKKIDYLSTVSGGGYIGSALTWFLHKGLPGGDPAGTDRSNFPLGQSDAGCRIRDKQGNLVLDFIRQHGKYLTPGHGLNAISLLGVALRSMFVSLLVYLGIFTVTMVVLRWSGVFEPFSAAQMLGSPVAPQMQPGFLIWLAAAVIVGMVVASLIFSLRTVLSSAKGVRRYKELIAGQKGFGLGWTIVFACALIGSLPYVHDLLGGLWQQITAAGASTITGAISGFLQHRKSQDPNARDGGKISTLRIVAGAFLLIYGMLLSAFILAHLVTSPVLFAVLVAGAAILGFVVNLNYIGFHRMYRDRLMETFMPDAESVLHNQWGAATQADGGLLEKMCRGDHTRPYHLVNANIVLVDSPTTKFRGRGGDSFLLSPLYCGSDATGWCRTSTYMKRGSRGMTLATAMAISGAAVNPDTGVGGKGLMRNQLVSMLMGLLNLRLGYWAPNAEPKKHLPFPPNFIIPGLTADILGAGLSENKRMIELTDGGHFENLALYELIRRQISLIIVSDAGADPEFHFGDLANAVERARVDFGAKIRFHTDARLEEVLPGSAEGLFAEKYKLAKRGYAVADITYHDGSKGTLIYMKSTLTQGLPADIYGYKSANPSFPDQSTADQFFDEEQFESYRELGYQLTQQMLNSPAGKKAVRPERAGTKKVIEVQEVESAVR